MKQLYNNHNYNSSLFRSPVDTGMCSFHSHIIFGRCLFERSVCFAYVPNVF